MPALTRFSGQYILTLGHCTIFSATLLLQLHETPFLTIILFPMKSHHIVDSTILSMMPNLSSILLYRENISISEGVKVQLQQQSAPKIVQWPEPLLSKI